MQFQHVLTSSSLRRSIPLFSKAPYLIGKLFSSVPRFIGSILLRKFFILIACKPDVQNEIDKLQAENAI